MSVHGAETTLNLSISLIGACFRHSKETSLELIKQGALDHLLRGIQRVAHYSTHRYAAVALANLCIYADQLTLKVCSCPLSLPGTGREGGGPADPGVTERAQLAVRPGGSAR